jgi:arylsulfatase A-like enzyme
VEHAGTLGLVEGDWKLIEPGKGPKMNRNTNTELGNDPAPQLYNLAADPGEKNNVAAEYPDRVKAMTATLERIKSGGY